jgi:hypothetical protein
MSYINTPGMLMVKDVSNKNKPECFTYVSSSMINHQLKVPNHRTAGPNVYLVSSEAQRLNTTDTIMLGNVIRFHVEHTGTLEEYIS